MGSDSWRMGGEAVSTLKASLIVEGLVFPCQTVLQTRPGTEGLGSTKPYAYSVTLLANRLTRPCRQADAARLFKFTMFEFWSPERSGHICC